MNSVTIGTVPYLNARPLVARLKAGFDGVRLVEAVPSTLAGMLNRGEVVTALVSSVIALSDPSLCALPAGGVVSDGPVASIRLMSRVPPQDIRTLALDTSSRTGIVLARVLLHMVYGLRPDIVSSPPDIPRMLAVADAAIIIGDPALRAAVALGEGGLPIVHFDLDLGSLWRHETGLPFVYALWTAPRNVDVYHLNAILRESAEWGIAHVDEIADLEAPDAGLPQQYCRDYLHHNIQYALGPREWEGLDLFRIKAAELGLVPPTSHRVVCAMQEDMK